MNFENLRSIRIMPKGIIMKNCERTTTKTRIQRCKSASSLSSRLKIEAARARVLVFENRVASTPPQSCRTLEKLTNVSAISPTEHKK